MANPHQLETLKRGAEAWNEFRRRNPDVIPDLREAQLTNLDLSRTRLDDADLSGADLSKAQLSHASLHRARLSSASLILADLLGAVLNEADLSGASFFGAFLFGTRLKSANLQGANLLGASLMGADLTGADLSSAHLMNANLHKANLTRATLTGADLTAASLVAATVEGADFNSCIVHGLSAWALEGTPRGQQRLMVTSRSETPVLAPGLEWAQLLNVVLYGRERLELVCSERSRLAAVVGKFRAEREQILDAAVEAVASAGFVPVIVELTRPRPGDSLPLLSKIAGLVRFTVFDLTGIRSSTSLAAALAASARDLVLLSSPSGEEAASTADEPSPTETVTYQDAADLKRKLGEVADARTVIPAEV
jgi:uncharacterized protein YjbI with pentapeptide repeats